MSKGPMEWLEAATKRWRPTLLWPSRADEIRFVMTSFREQSNAWCERAVAMQMEIGEMRDALAERKED